MAVSARDVTVGDHPRALKEGLVNTLITSAEASELR
jgi:hypothetical protein